MKSLHRGETGLLIVSAVCMAGAFLSVAALAAHAERNVIPDRLPNCTDADTLGMVQENLDAGDKLRVLGLHSPRELRLSHGADLRTCVVDVITDFGARTTTFMVGWKDRGSGLTFVAGEPLE